MNTNTAFGRSHPVRIRTIARWWVVVCALAARLAVAGALDEMTTDRWAKLREAERYQLNIAEKYYRENNWKVAQAEYEKFLTLYESSEGAPYAQLKWSNCVVQLKKVNTAIKDGYQSVIDYWPESPEAIASAFLIGRCYKSMGEIPAAKKQYAAVLVKHPQHVVATLARVDLLEIAKTENDTPKRVELWKALVYDTPRTGDAARPCLDASRDLAAHCFLTGLFTEGVKSLATSYTPDNLPTAVVQYAGPAIAKLAAALETKVQAGKLADEGQQWLKSQLPDSTAKMEDKQRAQALWFLVADLEAASGRADRVPPLYEQILTSLGTSDATLGRLAGWYRSQNRRDEARQTYARFADAVEGQNQMAGMAREDKQYDQAAAIYQRLVGQDPDRAIHWQSQTAATYRDAKKADPAVAIYQQLLTDDVKNANNWQWQIGVTYRECGKLKEAIAAFRLCDNFPESYVQMAWCHRGLKEYKEAVLLYNQILGTHPPSAAWALLQIGYTQEQSGDRESAIKSLQQVCKRFPTTGQASEAHAYLQDKYKINVTLGGTTQE